MFRGYRAINKRKIVTTSKRDTVKGKIISKQGGGDEKSQSP